MTHAELVAALEGWLAPAFALRPTHNDQGPVSLTFFEQIFQDPVVAIPDVHLGDGGAGDIFWEGLGGGGEKVARLVALLSSTELLLAQEPSARALQLGDWFDVWRAAGPDVAPARYDSIENAAAYQALLDLDARMGLAHLVGNHDASFLDALPDRRAAQAEYFRLGFWLGQNVYALHGHQTDLAPPPNATLDELAVHVATTLADYFPGVTTFEAYLDRFGTGSGVFEYLRTCHRLADDPGAQPRPPAAGPNGLPGPFVQRENTGPLSRIVEQVAASAGRTADLLIVGHSHAPCVAWAPRSDGGVLAVVDAGGWAYDQTNVLLAAGDTVAVYDVVRT